MYVTKTNIIHKCQNPDCGIEAQMYVNDNQGGSPIVDCQNPNCLWRYQLDDDGSLHFVRDLNAPIELAAAA